MIKKVPAKSHAVVADASSVEASWTLPPYKSAEFFAIIPRDMLHDFRTWPVYVRAVKDGLIRDDEWVGWRLH